MYNVWNLLLTWFKRETTDERFDSKLEEAKQAKVEAEAINIMLESQIEALRRGDKRG